MSKKENLSYPSRTSGHGLTENESNFDTGTRPTQSKDACPKQSEKCVYDSSHSDSGMWSGSNIQSEEINTPESPDSKSSVFTYSTDKVQGDSKSYMRLDSGIDVSVSQQLSELNLSDENVSSLNDLSSKAKKRDSGSSTNINEPFSSSHQNLTFLLKSCFQRNDEDGDTELHLAIFQKFIEAVYAIVRMVPQPNYLNIWNHDRQTPLHLAVLTKQPRLVRLLVCAGAAPDILDRSGNTALHLAVQADDLACVQAIIGPVTTQEVEELGLKYTPYPFHHTLPAIADVHNYCGQTCLHIAALNGNIDILRDLLYYGADINAKEWKGGQTCLHLAVERRDVELCVFLVAQKGLDADATDYSGYTAYQAAHCSWDVDIVRALRDHGVDTFVPSDTDTDDSDEEMVDVSGNSFSNGFKMNGSGLVNVGA